MARLTNWPGIKLSGISRDNSSALAMAPAIPFAPSLGGYRWPGGYFCSRSGHGRHYYRCGRVPERKKSRIERKKKAFVISSIHKHGGGQIAVSRIRQKGHNGFALIFRPFGQLHCRPQGRAGGNTHQDPLQFPHIPAQRKGIFVFHSRY